MGQLLGAARVLKGTDRGCPAVLVPVPGRCLPGSSQLSIDLLSRPKEGEEVSVVCLGSLEPPVLLAWEQKGAECPETSSCPPPGHVAPYISVPI